MSAVTTDRERERQQNLDDASHRRVEFPTEEEWKRADEAIGEATRAVMNVSWKIQRIAEFRGVRAPTLEDIGRVHEKGYVLEHSLKALEGWVLCVRGALESLGYVRALDNVPDDEDHTTPFSLKSRQT